MSIEGLCVYKVTTLSVCCCPLSVIQKLNISKSNKEYKIFTSNFDEIEKEFILEAIPCRMIGMNNKLMSQYIEFVADRLCLQLGYDKIYNSTNPFDFMDMINLQGKTNFFEKRVAEYQKAGVLNNDKKEESNFGLDEDF